MAPRGPFTSLPPPRGPFQVQARANFTVQESAETQARLGLWEGPAHKIGKTWAAKCRPHPACQDVDIINCAVWLDLCDAVSRAGGRHDPSATLRYSCGVTIPPLAAH